MELFERVLIKMFEINWLMVAIFLVGAGALCGFFRTKSSGFELS